MSIPKPCSLSKTGECKHGGNKYYNYGFLQGTGAFCRLEKKWVCDLKQCPQDKAVEEKS